jgi:Zn-dependent M16 (insulinase) family peptidase
MFEPSVGQTVAETSKRSAEENFQNREDGSIICYASRPNPSPDLESGEDEFTELVDSVPQQIYFILPEFLSFVDWCKENKSSLKNKEIGVIRTLKEISEGVDLNKGSRDYARESLINARKMCREEILNFLGEVAHRDVLYIYMETSNIEIKRVKGDASISFSHIDCFMRIFFFTDRERLKDLFYLMKMENGKWKIHGEYILK